MEHFDYYTAPSDEVFNEIKRASIELWKSKGSHPRYVAEKVGRIENIQNIKDNAWFMVAMFDEGRKLELVQILAEPAKTAVERLLEWRLANV